MNINTKTETRTYLNVWATGEDAKHKSYANTVRIEYNVHTNERIEYLSSITITREQAEKLLRDLQEKLYGIKQ